MIQFLVTAVIVVIGVFLLTLLLCLMTWVIVKLLRFLFPHLCLSAPAEKAKKPTKKKKEQRLEDRCLNCTSFSKCTLYQKDVPYPCRFFAERPSEPEA